MELGKVGVWWSGSWRVRSDPAIDVAAELERLGYGAIWSSGGFDPGLSPHFGRLLASTKQAVIASGIVNIWRATPAEVAAGVADLRARHGDRFLLGLGVSHGPLVDEYARPLVRMTAYLDALDAEEVPVAANRRVLAALGPRMLELAAARSAGAHPYLVPVEHTVRARQTLGTGPLLAPEVTAVLEPDPTEARELARKFTAGYLTLPNYVNNLRALGFGDEDLSGGGSDRLLERIVVWGDPGAVAARMREHHEAGADHVCVQVIAAEQGFPWAQYQALADAVFDR
jgi:probable F420-dependent oxidoreductase